MVSPRDPIFCFIDCGQFLVKETLFSTKQSEYIASLGKALILTLSDLCVSLSRSEVPLTFFGGCCAWMVGPAGAKAASSILASLQRKLEKCLLSNAKPLPNLSPGLSTQQQEFEDVKIKIRENINDWNKELKTWKSIDFFQDATVVTKKFYVLFNFFQKKLEHQQLDCAEEIFDLWKWQKSIYSSEKKVSGGKTHLSDEMEKQELQLEFMQVYGELLLAKNAKNAHRSNKEIIVFIDRAHDALCRLKSHCQANPTKNINTQNTRLEYLDELIRDALTSRAIGCLQGDQSLDKLFDKIKKLSRIEEFEIQETATGELAIEELTG